MGEVGAEDGTVPGEESLQQGIELFNAGRYFEAHEALEDAWRDGPAGEKQFLQGMVQAAVGMHHLSRGNLEGARGVLARAIGNLEPFLDAGVAARREILLPPLVKSLRAWLGHAEHGGATPPRPAIRRNEASQ